MTRMENGHEPPGACRYSLDHQLRLVAVDRAWSEFAVANGAPELVPPTPLGRSIFSFISDPTTAHIYEQLFRRVSGGIGPLQFEIRCDSPRRRRFLSLVIETCPQGFLVSSAVLRVETRPVQPLLSVGREAAEDLLVMCSWCKRIEAEGGWREVEEAAAHLGLFKRERLPRLSHGICETCYESLNRLIGSSTPDAAEDWNRGT